VKRGKVTVLVLGTAVGAGLVFLCLKGPLHDRLLQEWNLRKLDSEDAAERLEAAEALGRLRSKRAIPRLVALGKAEAAQWRVDVRPWIRALVRIGPLGVEAALRTFRHWDGRPIPAVYECVDELGPEAGALVPFLVGLLGGESEEEGRRGLLAIGEEPLILVHQNQRGAAMDLVDEPAETSPGLSGSQSLLMDLDCIEMANVAIKDAGGVPGVASLGRHAGS